MRALVSGSIAYDRLIHVGGRFADVGFAAYLAPRLRHSWGGCAGNIAYALRKLGDTPHIVSVAGSDFSPYADYLRGQGIGADDILILPDEYTAQAFMLTDADGRQLIAFHPGACGRAEEQPLPPNLPPCALAIVSPNGKAGMVAHCRQLAERGLPFVFDLGQALGQFSREELLECLRLCAVAAVNEEEAKILRQVVGKTTAELAQLAGALLVTKGADGSEVFVDGQVFAAPAVCVGELADPTGCGDAYRAGLLHARMRNLPWLPAIRFASVVAGIKAAHDGAQGYALTLDMARQIYRREFNEECAVG